MGDDPIRWKEHYLEGLAPLPVLRRVTRPWSILLVAAVTIIATGYAVMSSTARWPRPPSAWPFITQGLLFLLAATLVVTVRAAGAVSGERERQTWESLRLTPLTGQEFLRGKLRGILDAVIPYYVVYAGAAGSVSSLAGLYGLIPTAFSLVLVWPLLYYATACGLRTSVNCRSTWAAVVLALLLTYVTGISMCLAVSIGAGLFFMTVAMSVYAGVGPSAAEVVGWIAMVVIPAFSALALAALAEAQMKLAEARALGSSSAPG